MEREKGWDLEERIFCIKIYHEPKDNCELANLIQLDDYSGILNFSF